MTLLAGLLGFGDPNKNFQGFYCIKNNLKLNGRKHMFLIRATKILLEIACLYIKMPKLQET